MENVQTIEERDVYKKSRILYIIEAALEYFISIGVGGAYLATLTAYLGLSDSLTGILTSFVSLGCGFQIVAIFLANKKPVKRWVTIIHTLNQLFFAIVYVLPIFNFNPKVKIVLFIAFLLLGHVLNNIVNAPKINWYMSLVDNKKRGRFTANKEIISLLGGMLFTFALGAMVDHYKAIGDLRTSFIICGIGIGVLTIGHTLTLIFSKEKSDESVEHLNVKETLVDLVKDKSLLKVVLISVLWNIASYATTPFYGSYQTKELGFTMTFISILSIVAAIVRSLFSRPMGRYADKHSFSKMLNICFALVTVAFAINIFTIPKNGSILYVFYIVLHSISMAGINSSVINLIYDYVEPKKRTAALALKSAFAGFAGFFTTLAVSPLVAYIQKAGNRFLGLFVYAQQVTSALAFSLMLVLLVYMNTVIRKIKKK